MLFVLISFYTGLKRLQVISNDIPQLLCIYLVIVVHQDVAKTDYLFPRSIGVGFPEGRSQHISGFPDYFKVFYNSIKQDCISAKILQRMAFYKAIYSIY